MSNKPQNNSENKPSLVVWNVKFCFPFIGWIWKCITSFYPLDLPQKCVTVLRKASPAAFVVQNVSRCCVNTDCGSEWEGYCAEVSPWADRCCLSLLTCLWLLDSAVQVIGYFGQFPMNFEKVERILGLGLCPPNSPSGNLFHIGLIFCMHSSISFFCSWRTSVMGTQLCLCLFSLPTSVAWWEATGSCNKAQKKIKVLVTASFALQ